MDLKIKLEGGPYDGQQVVFVGENHEGGPEFIHVGDLLVIRGEQLERLEQVEHLDGEAVLRSCPERYARTDLMTLDGRCVYRHVS